MVLSVKRSGPKLVGNYGRHLEVSSALRQALVDTVHARAYRPLAAVAQEEKLEDEMQNAYSANCKTTTSCAVTVEVGLGYVAAHVPLCWQTAD